MLLLVAAGWWDHAWVMFSCILILVCNSQILALPCHQQIIKINKWGEQEDFTVDILEENHSAWEVLNGLDLPQWRLPSMQLQEKQSRHLSLELNRTQRTRPPGRRGGTYIFLKQPVATREGAHFCYNQLLTDFAETAALPILLLPPATFVENLTLAGSLAGQCSWV